MVERYKATKVRLYFRGDAAFASPDIYEYLEAEGFLYAIRLPANTVLQESIAHLLTRPGATHSSVAAELGVTPTHLKTWRLELEAAGSAAATAAQKAEAAELVQLRRDPYLPRAEVATTCAFRRKAATDSNPKRPLIPI